MAEPDAQLAPRVLIAVGDALLRRVASTGLRDRGFSVSATNEESAALVLARSFAPDVILVDLLLNGPTGGTLFDALRWTWPKPPYRRVDHPMGIAELATVLVRR